MTWTASLPAIDPARRRELMLKRLFDVAAALGGLLLLGPVMAVVAAAVWLTMGPPVVFRQHRLGYRGRVYTLLKFRTMTDARDAQGALLPDAVRLTRAGRFLRSTTLDELPELINVLRGEMSVVGPRPLLPEYWPLYTAAQRRRHDMPPGMAGPVLAEGRNLLSWDEKFALDVWYVDHWSLGLDLRIVLRTLWKVLRREGVSPPDAVTMPRFEGTGARKDGPLE